MKMILGGKAVDASDGKTIDVFNPATMEVIDTVPAATQQDVDQAIANAVAGFAQWSALPLWRRIDVIKTFRGKLQEHVEELAHILTREMGKPISQAREEALSTAESTEAYIEGAHLLSGAAYPPGNRQGVEGNLILTVREPLGVVVAISPFNFPLGTLTNKIVPALLMGNAVIAKPATDTPLVAIRIVELLLKAGVPGNVIQIVTGSGGSIGKWLTGDRRIAAVTMTGSTQVGTEIAERCGKNLLHTTLELGGNDPVVILPDADLTLAVEESVWNRLSNCGQTCCATKRYLVHNSILETYLTMLIAALKTKKIGDPSREGTDCGPLVSLKAAKEVEGYVQHCIVQGAKLLLGGKRFNETFFEPTVLVATPDMDVAQDLEIFGPVWTVLGYDTKEEALHIANNTIYGLNSAVIGTDINQLLWFAKRLQAGTCVINGASNYESLESPFGGYKKSGIGRISVTCSLEELSQQKTIIFRGCY